MSDEVPVRPAHIPARRLVDVLSVVDGLRVATGKVEGVVVSGVTHDSAQVKPGDLFAALPGQHQHGAAFTERAAERGAVAVLTDSAGVELAASCDLPVVCTDEPRAVLGPLSSFLYGEPSMRLVVIGVTGTNGKTTSSYLIESGLRAAGHHTGLIGTVETRINDVSVPSRHTTPEATDLQALFAVMAERDVTGVAMEVSSHALALGRIDGTTFAVAVFTNLSQDHLDFHHDLETYYAAKARLFTKAFTDVAVINVDDDYGRRLASEATTRVVTVSMRDDAATWRARDVTSSADGSTFTLIGPASQQADVHVQLPGTFNVANAALSIVGLVEAGVPLPSAVVGVASCTQVPGRMQPVRAGQPFTAVVDYAHTPDAVSTLLATLRSVTSGRLIVVLGCGGDRDRSKRPLMGAAAAAGADIALLTSDNPRSEDPLAILAAMQAGAAEVPDNVRAEVIVEPDRRVALRQAVARAVPGDVVVVAGKGHERVQEIGAQRLPFDDASELAAAIGAVVRAS